GQSIGAAKLSGGGARSDIWCQIRADVLGMRLERAAIPAAAALGAAILAGVGSGALPSLVAAVRQLVRHDRVFEPEAGAQGRYAERFAHYRALYETMVPFNRRFEA